MSLSARKPVRVQPIRCLRVGSKQDTCVNGDARLRVVRPARSEAQTGGYVGGFNPREAASDEEVEVLIGWRHCNRKRTAAGTVEQIVAARRTDILEPRAQEKPTAERVIGEH